MTEEKKQIGRILLRRKLISQDELDKQLENQRSAHDGVPLASRIAQSGAVPENDVLRALSEQLGVPGIDLNQIAIPVQYLDLVPREVAESSRVLPVLARDDRLFLAMANPRDKRVIDELEFVTGRRVYPYVAITSTLERTIRDAYNAKELGQPHYAGPNAPLEALERVGAMRTNPEQPASRGSADASERGERVERDSVSPAAASVVVDEQMEEAAAEGDVSTSDFGTLGEEVSKVEFLSDELRKAA